MDKGLILHLQRLSTEDGPGIRTTVFFKGCPLRCAWCHNPESISTRPQIQWMENRCIGCDSCLSVCPAGALHRNGVGVQIDRTTCSACGQCVEECPAEALELLGRRMSVPDLAQELKKDAVFYRRSGGGVTLSGGEPGLQPDFTSRLLQELRAEGIHCALDTCGFIDRDRLLRLAGLADLVLFDVKVADPEKHRYYTGQTNAMILGNLKSLAETYEMSGVPIWIRTPLIPGATADRENIRRIGEFLAGIHHAAIERWELLAFNNLCRDKYRRLGLEWEYGGEALLSHEQMREAREAAVESGFPGEKIFLNK